jgi:hypothetical protein
MSEETKKTILYRYLTGPDDVAFCNRVTQALGMGWQLYGQPTLTYDSSRNRVICGQAVIKEAEEGASGAETKAAEQ